MRTLCTATDLIPTIPKVGICNHSPPLSLKFPSFLQYSAIPSKRLHRGVKASSMASTPSTVPDGDSQTNKPFSVLFVCLGNICRSPAAEGVFKHLVNQKNLHSKFYIDSAGTINYHEVRVSVFFFFFSLVHVWLGVVKNARGRSWIWAGDDIFLWWWIKGNQADHRMRAASKRRGIEITSLSRPIRPSDFRDFDLILAMDKQNRGMKLCVNCQPRLWAEVNFFDLLLYMQHLGLPIIVYWYCLDKYYYKLMLMLILLCKEDILGAFERWSHRETLPSDGANKVSKLILMQCGFHNV